MSDIIVNFMGVDGHVLHGPRKVSRLPRIGEHVLLHGTDPYAYGRHVNFAIVDITWHPSRNSQISTENTDWEEATLVLERRD